MWKPSKWSINNFFCESHFKNLPKKRVKKVSDSNRVSIDRPAEQEFNVQRKKGQIIYDFIASLSTGGVPFLFLLQAYLPPRTNQMTEIHFFHNQDDKSVSELIFISVYLIPIVTNQTNHLNTRLTLWTLNAPLLYGAGQVARHSLEGLIYSQ